jgi:hypothetical protein
MDHCKLCHGMQHSLHCLYGEGRRGAILLNFYLELSVGVCVSAGPEKYRERGNGVPRKEDIWQEVRSLSNEEPRIQLVSLAQNGRN